MSSGGGSAPKPPEGAPDSYYEMLEESGELDQRLKEELYNFYQSGAFDGTPSDNTSLSAILGRDPSMSNLELAQTAAEMELIEPKLGYTQEEIAAKQSLIAPATDLTRRQIDEQAHVIEGRQPLLSDYFTEAGNVDPNDWANAAQADVAQQFGAQRAAMMQNVTRTGARPGGGRMAALSADMASEQAKATAGARTTARRAANKERFSRLSEAVGGAIQ